MQIQNETKLESRDLGAVRIHDTMRRRNNSELMDLYEDIISLIRLRRLRWIGHINKIDKERNVYNIFYNQLRVLEKEEELKAIDGLCVMGY